jgi:hypothetical protein
MLKYKKEEIMARSKRKRLGKGQFAKRKRGIRRGTDK